MLPLFLDIVASHSKYMSNSALKLRLFTLLWRFANYSPDFFLQQKNESIR